MVKKAPPPLDLVPSKFFLECMKAIPDGARGMAVDFGSAFGRHAFTLADFGYFTIALDFDEDALASFTGTGVHPVRCDLDNGIPLLEASAALVVATEYPRVGAIVSIAALVQLNGFLVFETYSARGENWRTLPEAGAIRSTLGEAFEMIRYIEKPAGADKGGRCTVKALARREQNSGTRLWV